MIVLAIGSPLKPFQLGNERAESVVHLGLLHAEVKGNTGNALIEFVHHGKMLGKGFLCVLELHPLVLGVIGLS